MSSLDAYSQGIRSGSEINRLEREAMKDAFLSDSLSGYDTVKGNHAERILEIRREIAEQTGSRNQELLRWIAMAGILLLLVAGGFFFVTPNEEVPYEAKYIVPDTSMIKLPEIDNADTILPENPESEPIQTPELNNIDSPETSENLSTMEETDNLPELDNLDDTSSENQVPKPVIGISAYQEYIRTEMVKPTDEKYREANGKVVLTFYIDKNGHPINMLVKKSLCPDADAEALRLLISGPDWTIGKKQVELEIKF